MRVGGRDVTRWPPHLRAQQRARDGLPDDAAARASSTCSTTRPSARTFAPVRGFVESMLRPPWQRREEKRVRRGGASSRSRSSGSTVARPIRRPFFRSGQLRLLAIARALAQQPSLLLLDEPAAGLRAGEKAHLIDALQTLSQRGLTMVLVEHDMQFVGALAERVVVLDRGRVIADGTPSEVRTRPAGHRGVPRLRVYAMTALLDVSDLVVRYGPAVALDGVSLTLGAGERVALVGANGAGKSSLLNAICGVVRPAGGKVRVAGDDVTGKTPNHLVRRGLTQVPEGRQVFPSLPVEANLLLGAFGRSFRTEIVTSTIRYLRRRARGSRASRADLRPASQALRAPRPPRRTHVRRRAADGRDRPRADGRAARARHRRALARPGAARRRAARRVPPPAERRGATWRSCSSSRTRFSPSTSASAPTCSRRGGSSSRARARQIRDRPEVHSAYLGGGPG